MLGTAQPERLNIEPIMYYPINKHYKIGFRGA
jgi:hypothetical protein